MLIARLSLIKVAVMCKLVAGSVGGRIQMSKLGDGNLTKQPDYDEIYTARNHTLVRKGLLHGILQRENRI